MNRGYIKVWRKIEDSGLIQLPNTLALFMHLLLNATHKDRKVGTKTGVVELKRGQFISGRIALASKLEQSEREVRTSLTRLIDLEIISVQTTNKYSIYTIENYSKYQDVDVANDQQNDQQATNKRPADDQQTTTKQELKHLNIKELNTNLARINPIDDDFAQFWNRYPKKVGKDKALTAWKKKKPNVSEVLNALSWQVQCDQWQKDSGQFIPNPATYLNEGRWQDEQPRDSFSNWLNPEIELEVIHG